MDEVKSEEKTSNTPTKKLKSIEQKIKAGLKWQEKGPYTGDNTRKEQWKRNARYGRCVWDDGWTDGKLEAFNVNTIYAIKNTIRPNLYFKNPKVSAIPAKPNFTRDMYGNVVQENGRPKLVDNYKTGRLFSVKLNYELREIGFKNILKRLIDDNLCPYGIGWIKWGFQALTVAGHSNERDPKYSFWASRVDPRNVVYDHKATSQSEYKWAAERLTLTKSEAKENGMSIPEGTVCSIPEFIKDRNSDVEKGYDSDEELVVIWEFHDMVDKKIRWLLLDQNNAPVEVKEPIDYPYSFDGCAIHPLVLDEDMDDIIGFSIVEPIEEQCLAINRMRSKAVKQVDNFGVGIIRTEGAVSEEEMKNFRKTEFGWELVLKDGMMGQFQIVSPPQIGSDQYNLSELHKEETRTTLGVTDYMTGGADSRTATEGNIIQNASNIRIAEKRDIIKDFVIQCVRRLAAMIQEFSSEEEYINLHNEEMGEDYVDYLKDNFGYDPSIPFLRMTKQDIQGEYNFEFSLEDMIEVPKEVQLQQLTNMVGVIGQNQLLMEAANNSGISMEKTLAKMFQLGGIDVNELKKGGPAQLSPEQENLMFMAGMEVPEPHPKDKNDEHILSHKRPLMELEQQLKEIEQQVTLIQQQQQQMQVAAQQHVNDAIATGIDPATMPPPDVPEEMQQNIDALIMQAEPIQNAIRRIKIHIQMHDMERQRKDRQKLGGGSGMGQMAQGQPAANSQAAMKGQANSIQ
jgi:hypothetical protein